MAKQNSPDDLELQRRRAVAQSVGSLNQEWAYLELTIDGCVATLHHFFAGTKLEKYRPRAFKNKMEYLVKGAQTLAQMNFLEPYLPFFRRIIELGSARNWVVHGHLSAIGEDGSLKFVRHSIKAEFPKLEDQAYSFNDLQAFTREIHEFGKIMGELMDTLLDIDITDQHIAAKDV